MPPLRFPATFAALAAGAFLACACSSAATRPRVDDALPAVANPQAATFIMIQGDGFARNAQARLGSNPLGNLTWVNAQLLTAELPSGMQPGRYTLTVANPSGGEMTLPNAITVEGTAPGPAPTTPKPAQAPTRAATIAATEPPSPSPTPAPRTAEPTRRSPEPPTQSPAQRPTASPAEPPIPAPTQPPTQRPSATRTAVPQIRNQSIPNLAGSWLILDTVTYGPGTGSAFPFTVAIQQQGNQIAGGGSGLSFSGVIDGLNVHVDYVQDNGATGTFDWQTDPNGGSLAGSFTNSTGNGGQSIGQRAGSGTFTVYQQTSTRGGAEDNGQSRGKKKER